MRPNVPSSVRTDHDVVSKPAAPSATYDGPRTCTSDHLPSCDLTLLSTQSADSDEELPDHVCRATYEFSVERFAKETGFYSTWPHFCDRAGILGTLELYINPPRVIGPTLYRYNSSAGLVIQRSLPEGELRFFGLVEPAGDWYTWLWTDPVVQVERYRAPQSERDPLIHQEQRLRLWYGRVMLGGKSRRMRGRPPGAPADIEEKLQILQQAYEEAKTYSGKPPTQTQLAAFSGIPRQTTARYIEKGWLPDLFDR
jgi:hypothetical protein